MNILIFPSGSAVAQEIYDSLKYIKNVKIYGTDYDDSNYSSIYFENYIPGCPFVKNEDDTIAFLKNVIINNNINYIFPAFDSVIPFLKKNEIKLGSKIICPELEIVELCNSKLLTYNRLQRIISIPTIYRKDTINDSDFPLYVKPVTGYGTRNHSIIRDKTELEKVDENNMIILELLTGDEFTVDCFTDFNGKLLYNKARKRIRTINGISIHSATVDLDVSDIALKINKEVKMNGSWFFQLKYSKDNQLKLLEIACRIPGAMCVNRVRGINFSWLSILNCENKTIEPLFYNDISIECIKMFKNIYRTNFEYDNIYCDLDDTLILHDKVNVELIAFLFVIGLLLGWCMICLSVAIHLDKLRKNEYREDKNFDQYQSFIITYCKAGFHKDFSFIQYYKFMVKVVRELIIETSSVYLYVYNKKSSV